MYGLKKIYPAGLAIVFILALSACGLGPSADDIEAAIREGVIASFDEDGNTITSDSGFSYVTVHRGTMERNVNLQVNAMFADVRRLYFDVGGGLFMGPLIEYAGTRVQEGDALARQEFPYYLHEPVEIARTRLEFQIEQFEARVENERRDRAREINIARAELNAADGEERAIMRLRIRRLELLQERLQHESERIRQEYHERLEDMYLQGEHIYAPFDGVITMITGTRVESIVDTNTVFFLLADEDSLVFVVETTTEVLRHGNVLTVSSDYFEFDAKVVTDALASGHRSDTMFFAMLPADPEAMARAMDEQGLTPFDLTSMMFTATVSEVLVHDALLLPVRAVRQEDRAEYVIIYNEGRFMKRYVSRGLLALPYVQILMGVEEGQRVVLP